MPDQPNVIVLSVYKREDAEQAAADDDPTFPFEVYGVYAGTPVNAERIVELATRLQQLHPTWAFLIAPEQVNAEIPHAE
jgi:hypothetical protein